MAATRRVTRRFGLSRSCLGAAVVFPAVLPLIALAAVAGVASLGVLLTARHR